MKRSPPDAWEGMFGTIEYTADGTRSAKKLLLTLKMALQNK